MSESGFNVQCKRINLDWLTRLLRSMFLQIAVSNR